MWLPGPRKVLMVNEEPRVALSGLVRSDLGPITVLATHLSFVPVWNRQQLHKLRKGLAALPTPHVLMGDLNLSGRRPAAITGYQPLGTAATFPVDAPDRQLDHILLRGQLGPVRATATPALPISDHRPLIVDL
jgi:endonuclease/exonuclease/phosphatase family metal-dependent hydrolase